MTQRKTTNLDKITYVDKITNIVVTETLYKNDDLENGKKLK